MMQIFVDGVPWLQAELFELGLHFLKKASGEWNLVERVVQEIKQRTNQL